MYIHIVPQTVESIVRACRCPAVSGYWEFGYNNLSTCSMPRFEEAWPVVVILVIRR